MPPALIQSRYQYNIACELNRFSPGAAGALDWATINGWCRPLRGILGPHTAAVKRFGNGVSFRSHLRGSRFLILRIRVIALESKSP